MGSGAHPVDHLGRVFKVLPSMLIVMQKKTEEVCGQAFGGIWQKQNKQVPLPQDLEHPTGTQSKMISKFICPGNIIFLEYISGLLSGVICLASLFNRCGNQFPEN